MKKISDEEIYKLRKSGMSYREIVKYFHANGIKIARNTIASICKRIFAEKGEKEEELQIKRKRKKERKGILSEEVYELREKGMSYKKIAEYYYKNGVDISEQTIGRICKEIYKEKGKKEPETKANVGNKRTDIKYEKIYELREQGMSYTKIVELFKEKGIEISSETIRRKCKEIYKEKGKTEPKTKANKRTDIKDEKIYELREQGMSYTKIAEHYKKEGVDVSYVVIRSRCKKIYREKGKEEPKTQTQIKRKIREKRTDITDEEIYELRKSGMPYIKIEEYFKKKGIIISRDTISNKCKRIFAEKGEKEPKTQTQIKRIIREKRTDITDEEIYELRKSGMSYKKIVRVFHIRGIKISSNTVAKECKRIFTEKGEEETQIKRKEANKPENLLEKLNKDLNDKIGEKINTEKELAELKDREVRNARGVEK